MANSKQMKEKDFSLSKKRFIEFKVQNTFTMNFKLTKPLRTIYVVIIIKFNSTSKLKVEGKFFDKKKVP